MLCALFFGCLDIGGGGLVFLNNSELLCKHFGVRRYAALCLYAPLSVIVGNLRKRGVHSLCTLGE